MDIFDRPQKVTPQERIGQAILDLRSLYPMLTASERADKLDEGAWLYAEMNSNGNH